MLTLKLSRRHNPGELESTVSAPVKVRWSKESVPFMDTSLMRGLNLLVHVTRSISQGIRRGLQDCSRGGQKSWMLTPPARWLSRSLWWPHQDRTWAELDPETHRPPGEPTNGREMAEGAPGRGTCPWQLLPVDASSHSRIQARLESPKPKCWPPPEVSVCFPARSDSKVETVLTWSIYIHTSWRWVQEPLNNKCAHKCKCGDGEMPMLDIYTHIYSINVGTNTRTQNKITRLIFWNTLVSN